MEEKKVVLEVNNLSKQFEKDGEAFPVLEQVSFTLTEGEVFVLLGRSGCGKTTLLRIVMDLLKPSEGTVENTFRNTVAVFQEPRLLPWRTALQNVNLVLGDGKSTLDTAKKYLELVKLEDALDKYPRELSGGMQQRASLARALAAQGDLLVLDEPFKAMDEALRDHVMELVNRTDAAILLVTHEAEEAKALGCEIIRL